MSTGDVPSGSENTIAASAMGAGTVERSATTGILSDESARIPLAPVPERVRVVPAGFLRRLGFLEGTLVLLVLAFAFVVASFRAGNSDLFLRLATGRLIAGGEYQFGTDPFTFTAEGIWVNHGWLFDLVCYLVYRLGEAGGIALVVGKALLVTFLAWLMLQTGTLPGERRWLPAVFTVLAILAASPRMLLQPIVVSLVLLAATLYLLVRVRTNSRWIWLLPVVCLVWVNTDEWFFLGPLTIALFLLGEWVQQRLGQAAGSNVQAANNSATQRAESNGEEQSAGRSLPVLGLVLLVSLAACLVNPYHVRAFALPPPLDQTWVQSSTAHDPIFRALFLSPLEKEYFHRNVGLSAAGLTFYPLALLGLLSFALTFSRGPTASAAEAGASAPGGGRGPSSLGWRWWRVIVWLVFLALASWNYRCIPFFAVVAGPITAMNFLDFARWRQGTDALLDPSVRSWAISGRLFTIVLLVLLGAVSLPGWLQAQPYHTRFVGWGIDVDQGLAGAAREVATWHEAGQLTGDERFFNTNPIVVCYFAWFCADARGRPLARGFMDQRLPLFRRAAEDFVATRQALSGTGAPSQRETVDPPSVWRKVFQTREVRFLVFHDHNFASVLPRLFDNPDEWQDRYIGGRSAVFAWRDPRPGASPSFDPKMGINFDARAFGPNAEKAPDSPGQSTKVKSWWREIVIPEPAQSVYAGTALQEITRFEALSRRYALRSSRDWQAFVAASVIGTAAGRGGPVVNGDLLPMRMSFTYNEFYGRPVEPQTQMDQRSRMMHNAYVMMKDLGPPASLYRAIRSARQALHDNPEDVTSNLVLAQSYLFLGQRTEERVYGRNFGMIETIRQCQAAAALRSILLQKNRPDAIRTANMLLANLLSSQQPFFESYVVCLRDAARHAKAIENILGGSRERSREEQEALDKHLKSVEQELKRKLDSYEVTSIGKPLLQKAYIALEKGLSEKALNLLLSAEKPDELADKQRNPNERPGATLAISLLLGLGRLEEAREILLPTDTGGRPIDRGVFGSHHSGLPAYEMLVTQLYAAAGEYEAADQFLAETLGEIRKKLRLSVLTTLAELDFIGPSDKVDTKSFSKALEKDPEGLFGGMLMGEILLRNAPRAAGMPLQILNHLPIRWRAPLTRQSWKQQPAGWEYLFLQGANFLSNNRQLEADIWTLRAWLALEQGRTDRAVEYAGKTIALAEVQHDKNLTQRLALRSLFLAEYCLRLVESGKEKKGDSPHGKKTEASQ